MTGIDGAVRKIERDAQQASVSVAQDAAQGKGAEGNNNNPAANAGKGLAAAGALDVYKVSSPLMIRRDPPHNARAGVDEKGGNNGGEHPAAHSVHHAEALAHQFKELRMERSIHVGAAYTKWFLRLFSIPFFGMVVASVIQCSIQIGVHSGARYKAQASVYIGLVLVLILLVLQCYSACSSRNGLDMYQQDYTAHIRGSYPRNTPVRLWHYLLWFVLITAMAILLIGFIVIPFGLLQYYKQRSTIPLGQSDNKILRDWDASNAFIVLSVTALMSIVGVCVCQKRVVRRPPPTVQTKLTHTHTKS